MFVKRKGLDWINRFHRLSDSTGQMASTSSARELAGAVDNRATESEERREESTIASVQKCHAGCELGGCEASEASDSQAPEGYDWRVGISSVVAITMRGVFTARVEVFVVSG